MEFQGSKVLHPDQSIEIIDETDHPPLPITLGNLRGFHPGRAMGGTAFLEKEIFIHALGVTLQGQCPIFQMGQDELGNPGVVFQDMGLGEPIGWIEILFQVR